MPDTPLISVTIVCYNGAQHIPTCLAALRTQTWPNLEIIVIDNASTDASVQLLRTYPEVTLIENAVNTGFSAAQNQAIRAARAEWIVCLNLDTRAEPTFLEELWLAAQLDDRIGIVCPKVLRMAPDGTSATPPLIDSTGIYATPQMRHHNRGAQQPDLGQFDRPDYVFGYTGAAALFRRAMLEDTAINSSFLDEDYFAYREDSDLSWRAQLLGWHCLYTPHAVVFHQRHVFENNRNRVSALINMHSTKNRFLLRINNATPGLCLRFFLPATIRDIGVLLYCLLKERTSLPAFTFLWRERRRLFAKRRIIQSKRKVSETYIRRWFHQQSQPLPPSLTDRLETLRRTHRPS